MNPEVSQPVTEEVQEDGLQEVIDVANIFKKLCKMCRDNGRCLNLDQPDCPK